MVLEYGVNRCAARTSPVQGSRTSKTGLPNKPSGKITAVAGKKRTRR
jgi:hypothetical protein